MRKSKFFIKKNGYQIINLIILNKNLPITKLIEKNCLKKYLFKLVMIKLKKLKIKYNFFFNNVKNMLKK